MKRKTFARLQMTALGLLLIEVMMLLFLFLTQSGASAQVNGKFAPSHKGTGFWTGHADTGRTGDFVAPDTGKDGSGVCGKKNSVCELWDEAVDVAGLPDFDFANDFLGSASFPDGDPDEQGGAGSPAAGIFYLPPGRTMFAGGPSFPGSNFNSPDTDADGAGDQTGKGSDFAADASSDAGSGVSEGPSGAELFDVPNFADTNSGGNQDGPSGPGDPPLSKRLVPVPVPEPVTASLLIAGLAGAIGLRRRKHCAS